MKKKKIILAFFTIAGILLLSGCGFRQTGEKRYPIKLEVWGLFDDSDVFGPIFEVYRKTNPNIQEIKYKKLTPDTYKKELLEALASGQGPDIFLMQNTWLPSFYNNVVPMTEDILTEQKFRSDFVDVAATDFINQGKIYALPLTVDTLALYYNKDLFNQAGITAPPSTWNEFVEAAQKMTRFEVNGGRQIIQSGAALGTAYNINRSTDILNLLMLQNKTQMLDERGARATFDIASADSSGTSFPGENALNFYTQFAKADAAYYTWNSQMHYSTDAFSEGNLAMMFNYSWQRDTISGKAPKLNFAVAPVPQLDPAHPINYPNYWGYTVAKNKISTMPAPGSAQPVVIPNEVRLAEAWKFLKFLTTRPTVDPAQPNAPVVDAAAAYVEKTKKPAARKDLIEKQKSDVLIGVFAHGNLIAKNWMQVDPSSTEAIFADMIDKVNRGAMTTAEALKSASLQVTQLMSR